MKNLYETYNFSLRREVLFTSRPTLLVSLRTLAIKRANDAINETLSQAGISETVAVSFVKGDRDARQLLNEMDLVTETSFLGEIVQACEDPMGFVEALPVAITDDTSAEDIMTAMGKGSSFDESLYVSKTKKPLVWAKSALPWVALGAWIAMQVRDLLQQNDHPSPQRARFLQGRIRYVAAMARDAAHSLPTDVAPLVLALVPRMKALDAALLATVALSSLYLSNRAKLQRSSEEAMREIVAENTCGTEVPLPLRDEDIVIESPPLDEGVVSCPVEDELFYPREPMETKIDRAKDTCGLEEREPPITEARETTHNDTAAKAIVRNVGPDVFRPSVVPNQLVTHRTSLGVLGTHQVYSPVVGKVTHIGKNEITLSDIRDPEETQVEEISNEIRDLYQRYNDAKAFIKDFYLQSWYPVMLRESPLIDGNLSAAEAAALIYLTGGVKARFEKLLDDGKKREKSFDEKARKVVSEDNIQEKAKNEMLTDIKDDLEALERSFYRDLVTLTKGAENQSKVTLPSKNEFFLFGYYLRLYRRVVSSWQNNDTTKGYRKWLNDTLLTRSSADGLKPKEIRDAIEDECKKLVKGTFLEGKKFFEEMLRLYESTQSLDQVRGYVSQLGNNDRTRTEDEKRLLVTSVIDMFELYLSIVDRLTGETVEGTETSAFELTEKEANFIDTFFGSLHKTLRDADEDITKAIRKLDSLEASPFSYSITEIGNEQHRLYSIGGVRDCPDPIEEEEGTDYESPSSKYGFGDTKYWMRYCAIATLVSVANVPSWATGVPPPVGPIKFPVVYVPIKAFEHNNGFAVIGVTITGIYPFPWTLFSNLSSVHHIPIGDPTAFLKREIAALKEFVSKQVKTFREVTIRGYLREKGLQIAATDAKITELEEEARLHRAARPRRNRATESASEHALEVARWAERATVLQERSLALRLQRFSYEVQYVTVKAMLDGKRPEPPVDPKIDSIAQTELSIRKQFEKLDNMVKNLENVIAPLPVTTKPNTANFAFTLKDPRPVIQFSEGMDDNVNLAIVEATLERFRIKNTDFLRTDFALKASRGFNAWRTYRSTLRAQQLTMIKKDAFPKYENLKLSNVRWVSFLFNDWTKTGGKIYGIPGF